MRGRGSSIVASPAAISARTAARCRGAARGAAGRTAWRARGAVAEVMGGAGAVSGVAAGLKGLEAAMADPARADEMDEIIARYGEVQARFEELEGSALDTRAREG